MKKNGLILLLFVLFCSNSIAGMERKRGNEMPHFPTLPGCPGYQELMEANTPPMPRRQSRLFADLLALHALQEGAAAACSSATASSSDELELCMLDGLRNPDTLPFVPLTRTVENAFDCAAASFDADQAPLLVASATAANDDIIPIHHAKKHDAGATHFKTPPSSPKKQSVADDATLIEPDEAEVEAVTGAIDTYLTLGSAEATRSESPIDSWDPLERKRYNDALEALQKLKATLATPSKSCAAGQVNAVLGKITFLLQRAKKSKNESLEVNAHHLASVLTRLFATLTKSPARPRYVMSTGCTPKRPRSALELVKGLQIQHSLLNDPQVAQQIHDRAIPSLSPHEIEALKTASIPAFNLEHSEAGHVISGEELKKLLQFNSRQRKPVLRSACGVLCADHHVLVSNPQKTFFPATHIHDAEDHCIGRLLEKMHDSTITERIANKDFVELFYNKVDNVGFCVVSTNRFKASSPLSGHPITSQTIYPIFSLLTIDDAQPMYTVLTADIVNASDLSTNPSYRIDLTHEQLMGIAKEVVSTGKNQFDSANPEYIVFDIAPCLSEEKSIQCPIKHGIIVRIKKSAIAGI